jgi:MFS transporter, SHS family, sialic acid transporter
MTSQRGRWLTLLAALLGWMFDGLEMGLFPLVANDALAELLCTTKGTPEVNRWFGIVMAAFLIGAATGGVLFGWLGDKIGRVKAMTISVLLYSFASGFSAFSTEPWHLATLRFVGALGMGGEWALGVALVMEVWAGSSRALLAGLIGAAGNLGYTLCGIVALILMNNGSDVIAMLESLIPRESVDMLVRNNYWRMLMLLGAIPALLTFIIRIFVPESESWSREKTSGRSMQWSNGDLAGVAFGTLNAIIIVAIGGMSELNPALRIGVISLCLINVTLGFLFPAFQYLKRVGISRERRQHILGRMLLAAGLSGVALLGTWSAVMWQYQWVGKLPGGNIPEARPITQIWSSLGAACGAVLGALLAGLYGRRIVYASLCVASIAVIIAFYRLNSAYDMQFLAMAAIMAIPTAAFYGWLPLYLPELFPTSVRASGQGFGFNFGRILAAVGNLAMPGILAAFDGDYTRACAVVPIVYVVGLGLIAIAPETKNAPLPE